MCGAEPSTETRKRDASWLGVAIVIAIHAGLLSASILNNSVAFDEYAHLPAGVAYWRFGWRAFPIYQLSPPLLRLWAATPVVMLSSPLQLEVPSPDLFLAQDSRDRHWNYGEAFLRANFAPVDRYHRLFIVGRFAMLPISCLGVWLAWKWAGELYKSQAAALAAGAMVALNPDLIAHGSLVGTDAGTAVAVAAALWLWWRRAVASDAAKPNSKRAILSFVPVAVVVAIAMLSKFTALLAWPAMIAMALVQPSRWRAALTGLVTCALVSWVVINLAYGFSGTFSRMNSFAFQSTGLKKLASVLPGATPVPVPRNFVEGLDVQKLETELEYPGFLNGQTYRGSRWNYYPIALAYKLPAAMLLLILLAIVSIVLRSKLGRWPAPSSREALVLAALIVLVIGLAVLPAANIGVRYLLPAYLPAIVLIARVFASQQRTASAHRFGPLECWIVMLVLAIETLVACPHYLSFINFIAGGPTRGWRAVNDSNFDWGQGLLDLKDWMREHNQRRVTLAYFGRVDPGAYGIEYSPITSPREDEPLVAVASYYLNGLSHRLPTPQGPTSFLSLPYAAELRKREPVGRAGPTIFIFRREDVAAAAREAREARAR